MKAVSMRTLGMSGALSTAKPACSTWALCNFPTPPISLITARPKCKLSLICAVVLMSKIALRTFTSLALRLTPPTASAAFSLFASHRAEALVAPLSLRANTLAPRASGLVKASAWMLTNKSACTFCAFLTRSFNGTKKSASRVKYARIGLPPTTLLLMRSRSFRATLSTTSFSRVPAGPTAPESSPPWPGSSAMMMRRSVLLGGVNDGEALNLTSFSGINLTVAGVFIA